jgi:hypothetical protein
LGARGRPNLPVMSRGSKPWILVFRVNIRSILQRALHDRIQMPRGEYVPHTLRPGYLLRQHRGDIVHNM